jgi:hypothetical protein
VKVRPRFKVEMYRTEGARLLVRRAWLDGEPLYATTLDVSMPANQPATVTATWSPEDIEIVIVDAPALQRDAPATCCRS